jgi:hypothetical protein
MQFKLNKFRFLDSNFNNNQVSVTNDAMMNDFLSFFGDNPPGGGDDSDHENYESCIEIYHQCEPKIKSKTTQMNIDNQLLVDLKHCSCNIALFNCFKQKEQSVDSLSNRLGDLFFNKLAMKCFHYSYQRSCNLYVLGQCIISGDYICLLKLVETKDYLFN